MATNANVRFVPSTNIRHRLRQINPLQLARPFLERAMSHRGSQTCRGVVHLRTGLSAVVEISLRKGPKPPKKGEVHMLPGQVFAAPPGLHGIDTNTVLDADHCRAAKAQGFSFCLRYVLRGDREQANDLHEAEAQTILMGGLP